MRETYYRIMLGEHAGKKGRLIGMKNITDTQKSYILEIEESITAIFTDNQVALA